MINFLNSVKNVRRQWTYCQHLSFWSLKWNWCVKKLVLWGSQKLNNAYFLTEKFVKLRKNEIRKFSIALWIRKVGEEAMCEFKFACFFLFRWSEFNSCKMEFIFSLGRVVMIITFSIFRVYLASSRYRISWYRPLIYSIQKVEIWEL